MAKLNRCPIWGTVARSVRDEHGRWTWTELDARCYRLAGHRGPCDFEPPRDPHGPDGFPQILPSPPGEDL